MSEQAGQAGGGITFSVLTDVVRAFADAIVKLTDAIGHVLTRSVDGFDAASARALRHRLRGMVPQILEIEETQAALVNDLSYYINNLIRWPVGSREARSNWSSIRARLTLLPNQVEEVLISLRAENNVFFSEDAFRALHFTLHARKKLYDTLLSFEKLPTIHDLDALKMIAEDWKRLVRGLRMADYALTVYLGRAEPGTEPLFDAFVQKHGRPPTRDDYANGSWRLVAIDEEERRWRQHEN